MEPKVQYGVPRCGDVCVGGGGGVQPTHIWPKVVAQLLLLCIDEPDAALILCAYSTQYLYGKNHGTEMAPRLYSH